MFAAPGFDAAWAEGAALSTEESIAYAQRGRGDRQRPATGWGSLTPADRAVVGLVSEGLANKAIAARFFISLPVIPQQPRGYFLGVVNRKP